LDIDLILSIELEFELFNDGVLISDDGRIIDFSITSFEDVDSFIFCFFNDSKSLVSILSLFATSLTAP